MEHRHDRVFDLDISRSRAPRAFRDKQNLWRDDIKRIYRLVRAQVDGVKHYRERERDGDKDEVPHLSIAIFGPSGAGKSSLLRTLADDVNRPSKQILDKETSNAVVSLPVIDPTTWMENDQFLYAFLATALEEERKAQRRRGYSAPQGLSETQLAFQEVNEYLRVIDQPAATDEHDPLGLSLQKLERHTSGLRLKEALGKFIEALAKELDAKVILLPVDDLDMTPNHLIESLRTYQSFLTHRQLIPVFTFTERMPEELIEVDFRRQLTDSSPAHGSSSEIHLSISEQLAVQFLARCFPVRNRVRLGPAPARVQRALYRVRPDEEPGQLAVIELLTISSFLLFGHPDKEDAHQIRAALRPSTLRRQFQVVDAMADRGVHTFRVPQLAWMANPKIEAEELDALTKEGETEVADEAFWEAWRKNPQETRLWMQWHEEQSTILNSHCDGLRVLVDRLQGLKLNATWATLFNDATWSLLNVHRDTLRELGLYLENLYSWSPKELRGVVLGKLLEQDHGLRRTVVDRWFNRTDFRRSQVLSLLAANVFRPWMDGEEPYGDEEMAIREQLGLESSPDQPKQLDDYKPAHAKPEDVLDQIRQRLSFPARQGLLWFLNVTLGFYMPQIMTRNWAAAVSPDISVRRRMSGNGWDLHHAPINAMRMADTKQEIFSFGMLFLEPRGYCRALEALWLREYGSTETSIERKKVLVARLGAAPEAEIKKKNQALKPEDALIPKNAPDRGHLLLRIWSSCGYSHGRYWAAFSLWRGLGLIGQTLELGLKHHEILKKLSRPLTAQENEILTGLLSTDERRMAPNSPERIPHPLARVFTRLAEDGFFEKSRLNVDAWRELFEPWEELCKDFQRLLRSHCLSGLMPGSLLDRNADEERLRQGFPRWEPHDPTVKEEIASLARDLVEWLARCWKDRIFPLPTGKVWIDWRDDFLRRVHGEYILGALWPRLNSAYLEEYTRLEKGQKLASKRSLSDDKLLKQVGRKKNAKDLDPLRWTAALAARAWSDVLLEYWRGCPSILRLLLTCPIFLKSRERFGPAAPKSKTDPKKVLDWLAGDRKGKLTCEESLRYDWLERLSLPPQAWRELLDLWKDGDKLGEIPGLIPHELCIERVEIKRFASRPIERTAISFEETMAEIKAVGDDGKSKLERQIHVSSEKDEPTP